MADFLNVSKITLIIVVTLAANIPVRAYAASRNEKRSIAGAPRSRSYVTSGVAKARTTSSETGSAIVEGSPMKSTEQHFLRRLGIETLPTRRSKRSTATKDPVPGYMTEILRKFQRETKKNWSHRMQKDKEAIVTGMVPYRVSSINSKLVKVYFHLSAVLKLESIALAEVVVRQPQAVTSSEREGRMNLRSLVICRETEANNSCRILAHKPVTRRRHFDIYDITRSVHELRTELIANSDGGHCSGCSIVMTLVHRGANDPTSGPSDVLLVTSNQPISDPVSSENYTGTNRQKNDSIDRAETRSRLIEEEDQRIAVELREANKDSRRQRREVTCSLSRWYLNFDKLGWTSWIRFPLGYYANYCSGSCVSLSQPNPGSNMTNHAFVKGLYRAALQNDDPVPQASIDALPAACCVPVRLSPINILYRNDDDNWIVRGMSEMVAEQSGCL